MDNIVLINEDNSLIDAKVIRYFKYNSNYYLIFTLGETDEKKYQKLYIIQILDELGEKIARNINDDEEWNEMQSMVKNSIRQIKKGNDNDIEKLSVDELNKIRINGPRFFKLDQKLVDILETDIVDDTFEGKVGNDVMENAELIIDQNKDNNVSLSSQISSSNPVVDDVDYKKLYFLVKADKESTEKLLQQVLSELILYKEKYGELEQN